MSKGVVFQCGACRALGVAADVIVSDDGAQVGLPCGACGGTTWLPVAGPGVPRVVDPPLRALPPPAAAPTAAPATPTALVAAAPIGLPAPDAAPGASPTLHLAASPQMSVAVPFSDEALAQVRAKIAALPAPTAEQAALAERFDKLLAASWSHEQEHTSLLKAAALAGELAFVGARYRAVLDVVRDEPRARAAQQELLTLAMATMRSARDLASTGGSEDDRRPWKIAGMLVLILALLFGMTYLVKGFTARLARMERVE